MKDYSKQNKKMVSVVFGSLNRLPLMKLMVDSLRSELSSCNFSSEIIAVDGGSTDGAVEWLTSQKDIITVLQHNGGVWHGRRVARRSWGYFMNLSFKIAQGKYICMISDDCLIVPGAIKNGVRLFEKKIKTKKKIGAIAFYWRNWPQEKKYSVGLTLGNNMFVNHGLYLRKALEEVGFIDEDTYGFYHADGDLCLKLLKAGYKCIDSKNSYVEHYSHDNSIRGKKKLHDNTDDWEKYVTKWKKLFKRSNFSPGGWLKRDFVDPSNTASKFPLSITLRIKHFLTS